MGTKSQIDRMESVDPLAKSARYSCRAVVGIFAFLLVGTVSLSCGSSEKKSDESIAGETSTPTKSSRVLPTLTEDIWTKALTKTGTNDRGVFTKDSRKVLFISRDRYAHKQRQLYELNLDTQEEKRLTFQDGDVFEAVANEDDGSIFYTSTTDSLKERPPLFFPETKTSLWPPTDIYKIKSSRDPHERWTASPGFDGFLHVQIESPGSAFLVASSLQGDDLHLFRSPTTKSAFDSFMQRPNVHFHSFVSSPKRKWRAWVEEEKESGASTISVGVKGQKLLSLKPGLLEIRDLQILEVGRPNSALKDAVEILFTGKNQKGGLRQAYWLKLKDDCLQAFMPLDANVADLRLSQDQKLLLWTVSSGNRSQVFMAPLAAPTGACEKL